VARAVQTYAVDYDKYPPMKTPQAFRSALEEYVKDVAAFKDPTTGTVLRPQHGALREADEPRHGAGEDGGRLSGRRPAKMVSVVSPSRTAA